jgi:predicted Zn finger-like uncharacterized protein
MALATQCPHCLTIFRVASDQLKLRGGLVRCGSCRQVFNGNEFLVEASVSDGHYQPAPGSKAQAASAVPAVTPRPAARLAPSSPFDSIPEVNALLPQPPAAAPSPLPPLRAPAPAAAEPIPAVPEPKVFRSPASPSYIPDLGVPLKAPETPAAAPDGQTLPTNPPSAAIDEEIDTATLLRHSSADDDAPAETDKAAPGFGDDDPFKAYEEAAGLVDRKEEDTAGDDEAERDEDEDEAEPPAFVKSAERKERVGHAVKLAMMVAAGVMVPVLLLQSLYFWRNPLAAAVPPLRPMLNGMCATFHCTVGLPMEIERLSLESNELQVVPPNQNIYALALVLRNRGASPQAWPYIELTLNNDDEKPVVRRVFRPREYLPNAQLADAGIAGESEQPVKLTFELNDALVSGYRIYLFYP